MRLRTLETSGPTITVYDSDYGDLEKLLQAFNQNLDVTIITSRLC